MSDYQNQLTNSIRRTLWRQADEYHRRRAIEPENPLWTSYREGHLSQGRRTDQSDYSLFVTFATLLGILSAAVPAIQSWLGGGQ